MFMGNLELSRAEWFFRINTRTHCIQAPTWISPIWEWVFWSILCACVCVCVVVCKAFMYFEYCVALAKAVLPIHSGAVQFRSVYELI